MTAWEIVEAVGVAAIFAVGCTAAGWLIVKGLILIGAWL